MTREGDAPTLMGGWVILRLGCGKHRPGLAPVVIGEQHVDIQPNYVRTMAESAPLVLETVETKDEVVVVSSGAGAGAGAGRGGRGWSSLPMPCQGPRLGVPALPVLLPLPPPPFVAGDCCCGCGCGCAGRAPPPWVEEAEAEREELEAEEEEERRLLLGLPSCSRWKMLGAPRAAGCGGRASLPLPLLMAAALYVYIND